MMKAAQGRMCGVLIAGYEGREQAIPYTSVWKIVADGKERSSILLCDATSEGRTGDYGQIQTKRDGVSVGLSLADAVDAFRQASRGDIVDISEKALQHKKNKAKHELR